MGTVFAVGVGGGLGALLRYYVASLVQPAGSVFPLGIFVVNITGGFMMGLIVEGSALKFNLAPDLRSFLEASLAAGLASLPEVARRETGPGWSPAEVEGYLRRFHYRLGPEDLEGLDRFEALLRQHGLIQID